MRFSTRIDALIEKVRLGRCIPNPRIRKICKTCDYRRMCRLYGE